MTKTTNYISLKEIFAKRGLELIEGKQLIPNPKAKVPKTAYC